MHYLRGRLSSHLAKRRAFADVWADAVVFLVTHQNRLPRSPCRVRSPPPTRRPAFGKHRDVDGALEATDIYLRTQIGAEPEEKCRWKSLRLRIPRWMHDLVLWSCSTSRHLHADCPSIPAGGVGEPVASCDRQFQAQASVLFAEPGILRY